MFRCLWNWLTSQIGMGLGQKQDRSNRCSQRRRKKQKQRITMAEVMRKEPDRQISREESERNSQIVKEIFKKMNGFYSKRAWLIKQQDFNSKQAWAKKTALDLVSVIVNKSGSLGLEVYIVFLKTFLSVLNIAWHLLPPIKNQVPHLPKSTEINCLRSRNTERRFY